MADLNDETFLIRACRQGTADVSECRKLYRTLDPSDVDLSFAGRLNAGHPSLSALDRLTADDPLSPVQRGDRWELTDRDGVSVCRLAKKFAPPNGARFLEGSVYAITTRFREDSAERYHAQLKRVVWSVVLLELVFEPLV